MSGGGPALDLLRKRGGVYVQGDGPTRGFALPALKGTSEPIPPRAWQISRRRHSPPGNSRIGFIQSFLKKIRQGTG